MTNGGQRATTQGFTLLEVLIAIVVLTVGVIALVWAFSSGMFASTDVEKSGLALNIAQAKMEYVFHDLKNTDMESMNVTDYEDANTGADATFTDYTVTVDLTDQTHPHKELMQVDVTVSWPIKGAQATPPAKGDVDASLTLTTLVADLDL